MTRTYIPKEISWLSFNARVLQEAEDKNVPLGERLKFLGIYSNNLDEYFRVRVAALKRLSLLSSKSKNLLGYNPKTTLKKIHEIVIHQNSRFEEIYTGLIHELKEHNIHIINEKKLDPRQSEFIREFFHNEVRTRLMPFLFDKSSDLPNLVDDTIYFAITLQNKKTGKVKYALLELPVNVLPRFVLLPENEQGKYIMFIDDIIRWGLREIFSFFDFDEFSAYTIKLTKDSEIEIGDEISESYIEKLSKSLQQRKWGSPVRFIYDREMPDVLLKMLIKKLELGTNDALIPGNRYHNFKDFMNFPDLGKKKFYYEPVVPVQHRDILPGKSIFSAVSKKDIMLFFPYHPFDHFIDLLREASIDPLVNSVHITLYRLARNSSVINALLNAARNGKDVTTVVELQARFDEEANILWSSKLMEEGVKVIYGVPGLKVHAKLCLISRVKDDMTQRIAAIGTGNFNEDTAKTYTDHLLITASKKITNEVFKTFNFFNLNYLKENYYHLVLSPFFLRNKINALIGNEIENARNGKKAFIYLKLNNLTDRDIVNYLYEASNAGVRIRLIIRGMFSLVPGLKKTSENIKAISIVDRLLEHTRFMIFCNDGNEEYYITSADLMTRNIEQRVEVTCPVFDKSIRNEMKQIFEIQWNDNVKSRKLDASLSNRYVKKGNETIRSQAEIGNLLKKINEKQDK